MLPIFPFKTPVEYVYLFWDSKTSHQGPTIFKVGRTTQENNKRRRQYPEGTFILIQVACDDCTECERAILVRFREEFTWRKDIGREYFEGDYERMKELVYVYAKQSQIAPVPTKDIEGDLTVSRLRENMRERKTLIARLKALTSK